MCLNLCLSRPKPHAISATTGDSAAAGGRTWAGAEHNRGRLGGKEAAARRQEGAAAEARRGAARQQAGCGQPIASCTAPEPRICVPADVPVLFSRGPYLSIASQPPLQVAYKAPYVVTILPRNMRIMLHRPEATQRRRWRAAGKIAGTGTPPRTPPATPPGCLALSTAAWATGRRPPPSGAAAPLLSSSSPRALVGPKHRTVHLFVQIRTRQGGCQGAMRSS